MARSRRRWKFSGWRVVSVVNGRRTEVAIDGREFREHEGDKLRAKLRLSRHERLVPTYTS